MYPESTPCDPVKNDEDRNRKLPYGGMPALRAADLWNWQYAGC